MVCAAAVLNSPPVLPRTPELMQLRLQQHESGYYFLEAETLAKRRLMNPAARWAHYGIDSTSRCGALKNGVWFAEGRVEVPDEEGQMVPASWEVCFLPDTRSPLYVRVGNLQSGDLEAAKRAAGLIR
jgi:hypothetical protein